MTQLLHECVAILNCKVGVNEFTVRQILWKAVVSFNGVEIAWADTTTRQYYFPALKIPITIPDPPDLTAKNNILNSLLSCAIAIKVFGDEWQEVHFILALNAVREWAIVPKNPAKDPFIISLQPLVLWNGSEPYYVKLKIYSHPNEEPKIIKLTPSELPDIAEIRRIVALTRL
jgi:hypothetical protein